ncbi:MAG: PQQ-binding-like beta-propeller repeat protein [Kiritimatiellia bacterium]|jgi:outer membrane protein assembly factor BamB|nr:PQQ-binding-like beta-propeller repeat protein [Kiritimatiellia bacterium]
MKQIVGCMLVAFFCVSCGRNDAVDQAKPDETGEPAAVVEEKDLEYWVAQARGGPENMEETVKALTAALSDPSAEVKVAAADALGRLDVKAASAAPTLVSLLLDHSPWARVSASETLVAIGSQSVPPLADAVANSESVPLRIRSVLALGALGAQAKDAIPVLEKVANDETIGWRGLAMGALKRIDPATFDKDALAAGAAEVPVALPEVGRAGLGSSADWPSFQGGNRDCYCPETGLLQSWPEGGPKLIWQTEGLGEGYSSLAISGGKIFTVGDFGAKDKGGRQCVVALNQADGKELWVAAIGPAGKEGSFSTPAVDGDLVYAVSTDGEIVCMETTAGQVKWKKNFAGDFGGKIMSVWQFSESPMIDGDKLLCSPGAEDAAIVALNKTTGEVIWKAAEPEIGDGGKPGAGYGSMVAAEIHGVRQYIQMTGRGIVSVDAATGKFLWGYNRIANKIANIPSARVQGNYVFATTGYNTGCALIKVNKEGEVFSAEEVYFLNASDFENHHGGVILAGDHIYGGSGTSKGAPVCIELATGKIAWKAKAPQRGSACVLYADGNVIFRYDRGRVLLVDATPESFKVKSSFDPPVGKGPAWSYPVILNKKLYLRHGDILLCYNVGA